MRYLIVVREQTVQTVGTVDELFAKNVQAPRRREQQDVVDDTGLLPAVVAHVLPTFSHTLKRDQKRRTHRVAVLLSVRVRADHRYDIVVELFPLLLRFERAVPYEKRRIRRRVVRHQRQRYGQRQRVRTFVEFE